MAKTQDEMIRDDALSQFLISNADGKWDRHFGTWDSIIWREGATDLPSESDYLAQKEILEQNARAKHTRQYPSIGDQLDDIYHNGIDGWKATIKAIKDANPKE